MMFGHASAAAPSALRPKYLPGGFYHPGLRQRHLGGAQLQRLWQRLMSQYLLGGNTPGFGNAHGNIIASGQIRRAFPAFRPARPKGLLP
jgi:hypothetical protein